jgi:hypothetical protein
VEPGHDLHRQVGHRDRQAKVSVVRVAESDRANSSLPIEELRAAE